MSKISLKGIASKMSASQMKNVTGGWSPQGNCCFPPCPGPLCHQIDCICHDHVVWP